MTIPRFVCKPFVDFYITLRSDISYIFDYIMCNVRYS